VGSERSELGVAAGMTATHPRAFRARGSPHGDGSSPGSVCESPAPSGPTRVARVDEAPRPRAAVNGAVVEHSMNSTIASSSVAERDYYMFQQHPRDRANRRAMRCYVLLRRTTSRFSAEISAEMSTPVARTVRRSACH